VKATGQIGTLIGQIFFGIMADKYGRKKMYGIELMIIIVMTFASAFSASTASGLSVFFILGMWRVFLGFGIGGDYPLSGKRNLDFFLN
jgi:MFS transporter, PHS family, inorganic phosphate transporter